MTKTDWDRLFQEGSISWRSEEQFLRYRGTEYYVRLAQLEGESWILAHLWSYPDTNHVDGPHHIFHAARTADVKAGLAVTPNLNLTKISPEVSEEKFRSLEAQVSGIKKSETNERRCSMSDYYLVLCESAHGTRYWRVVRDPDCVNDKKWVFGPVSADNYAHADDVIRRIYHLDAWLDNADVLGAAGDDDEARNLILKSRQARTDYMQENDV